MCVVFEVLQSNNIQHYCGSRKYFCLGCGTKTWNFSRFPDCESIAEQLLQLLYHVGLLQDFVRVKSRREDEV